ncbi:hypothetical protein BCR39DRAFT_538261 [Naematelia encephala]|uniref:Zn(2)-C6 fungal-type domain-containing protein n=1 Tax=Naematelia encephala TaxID=71784 RepID=A0A1Y2AY34_9TREE|nr:hypothetical protein BCR39DRAFT_538261 [Naematelia encephala]
MVTFLENESGPSRQYINADSSPAESSGTRGEKRRSDASRAKNLHACDRCRTKKTRCEPPVNASTENCQPCTVAGATCTFEIPLTVSRTKRVRRARATEDSDFTAPQASDSIVSPSGRGSALQSPSGGVSHRASPARIPMDSGTVRIPIDRVTSTPAIKKLSIRREGPTSLSYILHSAPTVPLSSLAPFASSHGYTIRSQSQGEGFIECSTDARMIAIQDPDEPILTALRSSSWGEVVSRLVERFLVDIAPLLPIVTREQVPSAGPTLLHAMAAVASSRRNCPREIFDTLRFILRRDLAEQDTLSDPTRENVQILLVSCLVDDLAVQAGTAAPLSVLRARLNSAIRMAQDLGMDDPALDSPSAKEDNIIWTCAGILDRWNATRMGARPILPWTARSPSLTSNDGPEFLVYLASLTQILARVLHLVYGPTGIQHTKDADLVDLSDVLDQWKRDLPPNLCFSDVWFGLPAGLLHLLHTTIMILLYRPFMRWSFICPDHLTLDLDLARWSILYPAARLAVDWASNQEDLMDLMPVVPYALGVCSFLLYHSFARRRDWDGVVGLEKLKGAVERWQGPVSHRHLSVHLSQLDVIPFLYSLSQSANSSSTSFDFAARGLNPTPGILNRLPETSIAGVTYLRDSSLPSGGILVATQKAAREIRDLPPGTVVIGGYPPDLQQPPAIQPTIPNANVTGLSNTGVSLDGGQLLMSTPDWEAAVAAFGDFAAFDGVSQPSM